MNEKTKELIAVGAAVAAHCQPCLKFHYAKARESGIDVTDINAAIDVGHQITRGAGKAMRDFHETLVQPAHADSSETEGCCGGNKDEASSEGKCC